MFKNIEAMLQDLYVMGLDFTALAIQGDEKSALAMDVVAAVIVRLQLAMELDKLAIPSHQPSLN